MAGQAARGKCRPVVHARKRGGGAISRAVGVVCEMLEQRQLLSALSGSVVQDQLTAYNSINQPLTTAPTQYGPEQFSFTGGQFVRELTQPDGTHIGTGSANGNFALAKYNADGSLDLSFGGGDGKATDDFGTPSDQLLNANLRPDGKILLFGLTSASGNYQVVLSRLNPDGTFDTTFGDNGKLLTGVGKNPGFGIVTSVLTDGRIHVTGDALDGSGTKGYEYDADGHNAIDRLAKFNGIKPAGLSTTPRIGPPARGTIGWLAARSDALGPILLSSQPLTPQGGSPINEGENYTLPLAGGDGWNITWEPGVTLPVSGHPYSASHPYADNGTYAITATSDSIYLRDHETLTPSADPRVVNAGTLTIEPHVDGAPDRLDLNKDDLVVGDEDFSTIQNLVIAGYASVPDSTVSGITSTDSQNHGGNAILAVLDNALVGAPDWPSGSGNTVAPGAILGKYTYFGDTNIDGKVTAADYNAVDAALGTTGINPGIDCISGDTNYDYSVGTADYNAIDSNLGLGTTPDTLLQTGGVLTHAVTIVDSATVNNVAPTITIDSPPTQGWEGTPIELSASANDSGWNDTVTVTWDVKKDGNDFASGTGDAFTFTPDDEGTYTVEATASDGSAQSSASATINVADVAPKLTISGSGDTDINQGYTISLQHSDPGTQDQITSWSIDWGDGNTSPADGTDTTATHQYATAGTYTIKATATDAAGSHDSNSFDVAVRHPGVLDSSFGSGGVVSTSAIGGYAFNYSLYRTIIDRQGRIWMLFGAYNGSSYADIVARFTPEGTLDTSFAGGGYKILDSLWSPDLATQQDGSFIVLQSASNGVNSGIELQRFHEDGTLDTGFGSEGTTAAYWPDGNLGQPHLFLSPEGTIFAYSYATAGYGDSYWAGSIVAKFNSAGALDSSFGNGGFSDRIDCSVGGSDGDAMAIQSDGKLLLAGESTVYSVSPGNFAVLRLNQDGTLDSLFGGGGAATTSSGGDADAVIVQPDGKILAAGLTPVVSGPQYFLVARWNSDGFLDTGFGNGGTVTSATQASGYSTEQLLLHADGRISVLCPAYDGPGLTLLEFMPDGTVDASFGSGGVAATGLSYAISSMPGGAIMSDGSILIGGAYEHLFFTRLIGDSPIDLAPHRTGGKFGEIVAEADKDSEDPANYLILTNNDSEEDPDSGARDYDNDTADIPTGNNPTDDDLARFTIKSMPNLPSTGTLSIELSDPTAVRVFKNDGTMLYGPGGDIDNLTLDLSNPAGYLSGISSGDLDVWLEGLTKDSDFSFSVVLKDADGYTLAEDDVHMTIAEWTFVGTDGNGINSVAPLWKDALVAAAEDPNGPWTEPIDSEGDASSSFYKVRIDGLDSSKVTELKTISDTYPDDYYDATFANSPTGVTESDNFGALYNGDMYLSSDDSPLTSGQRDDILTNLQLNAVHNGSATTQVATTRDVLKRIEERDYNITVSGLNSDLVNPGDRLQGHVSADAPNAAQFQFTVILNRVDADKLTPITFTTGADFNFVIPQTPGIYQIEVGGDTDLENNIYSVASGGFVIMADNSIINSAFKSAAWRALRSNDQIRINGVPTVPDNAVDRNRRITELYTTMYNGNHDFRWAGMAAFVSDEAGDAMVSASNGGAVAGLASFFGFKSLPLLGNTAQARDTLHEAYYMLGHGNLDIYMDIYPSFLAYKSGGIGAVQTMQQQGLIGPDLLAAWQTLDDAANANPKDDAKLWDAVNQMAIYEQQQVLQPKIFDANRAFWTSFTQTYGSYITSNIPGTSKFINNVPSGDFGSATDRLAWFSNDLFPKFQGWIQQHPGDIDLQTLFHGGY